MHDNILEVYIPKCSSPILIDIEDWTKISGRSLNLNNTGYVYLKPVKSRLSVSLHDLILNAENGSYVDHINRNKLDNRKSNLRFCTQSENRANAKKHCSLSSSSKYKGVYWVNRDKVWRTRVTKNGKTYCLGEFRNEILAARAYDKKAKELFGEFATINFPENPV